MAVAVGLDHRHQRPAGCGLAQALGVGAHRVEVDPGHRARGRAGHPTASGERADRRRQRAGDTEGGHRTSGGGEPAGEPVQVRGQRGRIGRPGGQQRAEQPGQDVAGTGRRQPGGARGVHPARAPGLGDDGRETLEQHHGAEVVGQPTGRPEPVGGSDAGEPRVLAVVRGQHGGRGPLADRGAQPLVGGHHREGAGIQHHRDVVVQGPPHRGGGVGVRLHPRADHPGLHPALGGHHLGPRGHHGSGGRPERAHHPRARVHRRLRGEHTGARVRPRAGHQSDDAAGVLVAVRPGPGQPERGIDVVEDQDGRGRRQRRREPDVDDLNDTRQVAAGPGEQPRLEAAEGHRHVSGERRPSDDAGVGVDAAGQVGRDPDPAGGHRRLCQRGRGSGQRPAPADPEDPVDHEVGAADRREGGGAVGRHAPGRPRPATPPGPRRGCAPTPGSRSPGPRDGQAGRPRRARRRRCRRCRPAARPRGRTRPPAAGGRPGPGRRRPAASGRRPAAGP